MTFKMVKYSHRQNREVIMKTTYGKVRGRIVELYGSISSFSAEIDSTVQTVIAKLNGRSAFKQGDIIKWSNALHIEKDDIGEYFFSEILSKR